MYFWEVLKRQEDLVGDEQTNGGSFILFLFISEANILAPLLLLKRHQLHDVWRVFGMNAPISSSNCP